MKKKKDVFWYNENRGRSGGWDLITEICT